MKMPQIPSAKSLLPLMPTPVLVRSIFCRNATGRSRAMKTALTVMLTLALSPLLMATSASSATSPTSGKLEPGVIRMSADKQLYDIAKQKYVLSGKVTVAFQDMVVTGPRAEMEMGTSGKPEVANFFDRPTFKRKGDAVEDKVVGDIIKVYLGENRYGAIGNVESYIATVAADPFTIRSDVQEFDNKNKVVSASGNVFVDYQGSKVQSSLANVRMKDDGKADRIIFSGGARLKKQASEISGNKITVMADSGNLIAENNVKTQVDLQAKAADGPSRVVITSDYQQYDKSSDVMIASGNVKILYGDYVAVGPKATFKLKDNDIDRIFLTGRATITETGRTITADKITITTNPKNFEAVGNVKVNFKNAGTPAAAKPASGKATPQAGGAAKSPSKPAGKPLPQDDPSDY
jgi:lipopolysaccharide export system protein LptA